MVFWIHLDQRLAGARHPDNGRLHPDAVENELSRRGIVEEQDRDVAWSMLDAMTQGRIEAENEKIDPERERDRGGTKPHAKPR